MELIFIAAKIFQYIFVAPIWWLAGMLASFFFPFEGDKKHEALALLFAMIITIALIAVIVWWMT